MDKDKDETKKSEIPIVIIAYNNLFFVKRYIEQCRRLTTKILILDNKSEYQPLLDFYRSLKSDSQIEVILLDKNYGHTVYQTFANNLPDLYVLSDADLQLNPNMPNNAIDCLLDISEHYQCGRVGLALDLSDHHLFIKGGYGELIYSNEGKHYRSKNTYKNYEVYLATIDTTFTLINRKYQNDVSNQNGLRIAGNFMAKHLPWYHNYLKNNIPKDELECWVKNNVSSSILRFINVVDLFI